MKDFLSKEIAYYTYLRKMKTIVMPSVTTMMPVKTTSIDRLVEHFVSHLQADYPATVHTLLRTSEKLKAPVPKNQIVKYCALCNQYVFQF